MQINNGSLIGKMHKLIPENQTGDFKIEYKIATKEVDVYRRMLMKGDTYAC